MIIIFTTNLHEKQFENVKYNKILNFVFLINMLYQEGNFQTQVFYFVSSLQYLNMYRADKMVIFFYINQCKLTIDKNLFATLKLFTHGE